MHVEKQAHINVFGSSPPNHVSLNPDTLLYSLNSPSLTKPPQASPGQYLYYWNPSAGTSLCLSDSSVACLYPSVVLANFQSENKDHHI